MSPELQAAFDAYESAQGFGQKWHAYGKLIDAGGVPKWRQGVLKKLIEATLKGAAAKALMYGRDPEREKVMALDLAVLSLREKALPAAVPPR